MNRSSRDRVWIALAGGMLLLSSLSASAQERILDELVPADAFVEDSSELSTSLREVQYGIQIPYGFEQLMREDAPNGRYVRRAAGLWAVFPRSEYMASGTGYVATWPAGTYFHIGPPRRVESDTDIPVGAPGPRIVLDAGEAPIVPEPADGEPILSEPSDGRTTNRTPAAEQPAALDDRAAPPRRIELIKVPFVVDVRYRRARIRSIVEQANRATSQAARGPSPSSSK